MNPRLRFSDPRNVELLRELTISQFKLKDQSTFFGLLWSLLNPLLMVGILFVFFSQRFGGSVEHYSVFLMLGMVQYTHFANATNNSMRTLLTMRQLTREAVFPKELLVVSSTLSNTIDFSIALAVTVVASYFTGIEASVTHLLFVPVLLLQFVLVTWVSLFLAAIYPLARDLEHIYQVFLRALMFVTPIFYTSDLLGEGPARHLLLLNPLAQLLEVSRGLLIHGTVPSAGWILVIGAYNVVLTAAAWWFFKRFEPRIAEYV